MISAASLYKAAGDNTGIAQMAIKMWSDNTLEGLTEDLRRLLKVMNAQYLLFQ